MFVDTHAHLNFKGFKEDFDEVYKASLDANVGVIVNVGSNYATSLEAVRKVNYALTRMKSGGEGSNSSRLLENTRGRLRSNNKNRHLYAAVGLHPIHLSEDITETCMLNGKEYKVTTKKEVFDYEKYLELAKNEGVVAIGETGLDYFHLKNDSHAELVSASKRSRNQFRMTAERIKQIQKDVFKEHIKLAKDMNLPLILHCRGSEEEPDGAYDEMIDILMSSRANEKSVAISDEIASSQASRNDNKLRGVMHCFVGTMEQAKKFINLGFYIGVNGIVTFKNSTRLQDIIRKIPLEKIVLETDCPFLAPDPYRGKRNEPKYIPIIAQKIAQLKNMPICDAEEATTENAKKIFKI